MDYIRLFLQRMMVKSMAAAVVMVAAGAAAVAVG